jgi:hypothetical protein
MAKNESKIRSLADPHAGEKWKEVFMKNKVT